MKNLKKQICILAGIACFGIAGTASANAVGSAQINNCLASQPGGASGVSISETTITWSPNGSAPGTGCFNTGSPTLITSSQPDILSGDTGNIKDLTFGGGAVDQFLTFEVPTANLDFVLTGFGAASTASTACDTIVGDSCIFAPGSPFDLTNTSGGVAIDFTMLGTIDDAGVTNNWVGLFTTQFGILGGRETTLDVQNTFLSGGSISSTYSATIDVNGTPNGNPVPTPEPGTMSMILLGCVGLIGFGRKQFVKF